MFEKDQRKPDQGKPHDSKPVPALLKEDALTLLKILHYSLGYPTLTGIHNRALRGLEAVSVEYDKEDKEAVAKAVADAAAAKAKAEQDAADAAALERAEAVKAEEEQKAKDLEAADRARAKLAADEAAAPAPVVATVSGEDVARRPV